MSRITMIVIAVLVMLILVGTVPAYAVCNGTDCPRSCDTGQMAMKIDILDVAGLIGTYQMANYQDDSVVVEVSQAASNTITITAATADGDGELIGLTFSSSVPILKAFSKEGRYTYPILVDQLPGTGPFTYAPARYAISHLGFCFKAPSLPITLSWISSHRDGDDLTVQAEYMATADTSAIEFWGIDSNGAETLLNQVATGPAGIEFAFHQFTVPALDTVAILVREQPGGQELGPFVVGQSDGVRLTMPYRLFIPAVKQ